MIFTKGQYIYDIINSGPAKRLFFVVSLHSRTHYEDSLVITRGTHERNPRETRKAE